MGPWDFIVLGFDTTCEKMQNKVLTSNGKFTILRGMHIVFMFWFISTDAIFFFFHKGDDLVNKVAIATSETEEIECGLVGFCSIFLLFYSSWY